MNTKEILQNLCYRDTRHPDFKDHYPDGEKPTPRNDCFCDNCFHGRDPLAVELLKHVTEEAQECGKGFYRGTDGRCHICVP